MKNKFLVAITVALLISLSVGISVGFAAVPKNPLEFSITSITSITSTDGFIHAAFVNQEQPLDIEIEKSWLDWKGESISGAVLKGKTATFVITRSDGEILVVNLEYDEGGIEIWTIDTEASTLADTEYYPEKMTGSPCVIKVKAYDDSNKAFYGWTVEETSKTSGFVLVDSAGPLPTTRRTVLANEISDLIVAAELDETDISSLVQSIFDAQGITYTSTTLADLVIAITNGTVTVSKSAIEGMIQDIIEG